MSTSTPIPRSPRLEIPTLETSPPSSSSSSGFGLGLGLGSSSSSVGSAYTSSYRNNSPTSSFHRPAEEGLLSPALQGSGSTTPSRRRSITGNVVSHARAPAGGVGVVNRVLHHSFTGRTPSATAQPGPLIPHSIRYLLSPRILSPVILWSVLIYLVHSFLLPLPVPTLSSLRPVSDARQGNRDKAEKYFLATAFPQPPIRLGDDTLDSLDPLYRPFKPLPPPESPFPRLRPTRFLPPRCLEQWFANGETNCGQKELGEEEKLDVIWLWVNGSDPRWEKEMIAARREAGIYSPIHHFREQNELVHSMRSVLDSLPGRIRTVHLITADFAFEKDDMGLIPGQLLPILNTTYGAQGEELSLALRKEWRILQSPTWLNYSQRDPQDPDHPYHKLKLGLSSSYPVFRYAGHSEVFHLPTNDRNGNMEALGEREWKEAQWRGKALPSFNSMAIESRIGWLHGLADVALALNDDFFLLRPHAVSDFHTPFYGSVIRFDHNYMQQVRPMLHKALFNDAGESGGLYHANWLLSRRFPRRLRPYFAHVPKVITRGLHHEASLMFREALTISSQRKFREVMEGSGDIQIQWLLTSLRVERWREALLWTYAVANLGQKAPGEEGHWGDTARMELREMFGLMDEYEYEDVMKIEVHKGDRWTLEPERIERVLEQAGWEAPKASEFLFSSMDGHIPPLLKPEEDPAVHDKCLLDLERCFGSFWTRSESVPSSEMFTRLAFQYPDCGDCLIKALVTASGPLGLSAFLPPHGTTFLNAPLEEGKAYPKFLPPPHLPLTPTWHEADFSLGAIMQTTALPEESVDMRVYSMKLLSRYLYLSAQSPSHFHMLRTAAHARDVFRQLDNSPDVSILGLNDDIDDDYDQAKEVMLEWFEKRWPNKAVWERGWEESDIRNEDE